VTFNIKARHEVDSRVKGLASRIHGLDERLEKLPVVKRAGRYFIFNDGGSDGDDGSDRSHNCNDGSDGSHGSDDGGIPTAASD
jgi:hypothetical protein